jgi:hypothetical protein
MAFFVLESRLLFVLLGFVFPLLSLIHYYSTFSQFSKSIREKYYNWLIAAVCVDRRDAAQLQNRRQRKKGSGSEEMWGEKNKMGSETKRRQRRERKRNSTQQTDFPASGELPPLTPPVLPCAHPGERAMQAPCCLLRRRVDLELIVRAKNVVSRGVGATAWKEQMKKHTHKTNQPRFQAGKGVHACLQL